MRGLLWEIARMMFEQGLIAKSPCRRLFLGAAGDIEIGEEKDEFFPASQNPSELKFGRAPSGWLS